MNLPPLPKQNKTLEASFGLAFRKWFDKNPRGISCTYELKDTRGKNSLPFSEVKEAQINFGMKVKSAKGVLIRLEPTTEGIADYGSWANAPAYVVIKYPKQFVFIDIETFQLENKRSKVRSLSASRAKEISILCV